MRRRKIKKTGRLYEIAVNPGQYINTVQLVVTLINLVMRCFSEGIRPVAGNLLEKGAGEWLESRMISPELLSLMALLLAGAVLLYILLTFGVLIPKRLGEQVFLQMGLCVHQSYLSYYQDIQSGNGTGILYGKRGFETFRHSSGQKHG